MTQKERLYNAMHGIATDRPPCICPGGMMNMVTAELMEKVSVYLPEAHTNSKMMASLAKAVNDEGCFENVGVPFCMTVEAEGMGATVDLGSDVYEPHVISYVIDSVSQLEKLSPLELDKGRVKVVLDAIRLLKESTVNVPIIGNLTGPISTASSVMEPVVFYKELRKKPEKAHQYMAFITDQLVAFGRAQLEAGADVIAISDPSGTGEILGPKLFGTFAVPYLNKLVDGLQRDKMGTIVHICGHMNYVYPQMNQVRSDVLSFDSVVNMKEARRELPNRVLMGNVSTYAIEFADFDKVSTLTKVCQKNGSNILSPACGLGMKSPLKNVKAILETLTEEENGNEI